MKAFNKNLKFILFFISIFFITTHIHQIITYANSYQITDDLGQDYLSSLQIIHKKSIYNILKDNTIRNYLSNNGYQEPFNEILNNYHPPIVSIIHLPLGYFFSYKASIYIVSFLIIISVIFIINFLCDKYNYNKLIVFSIYFSSIPFLFLIQYRNINWIILLIISVIFYIEFEKNDSPIITNNKDYKKDLIIGFLLALATQIKVFPIILLFYFLILKRLKIIISFLSFNILLFIISSFILQFQDIILYYEQIAKYDLKVYACTPSNLSILHLIIMIFGWKYNEALIPIFYKPFWVMPLFFFNILSIISLNCYLCIKAIRNQSFKMYDLLYSLWIISFFFFSPVLWEYSLNYLIIPICVLFSYKKYTNFYLLIIISFSFYMINILFLPEKNNNILYMRHFVILIFYIQNVFCIKRISKIKEKYHN